MAKSAVPASYRHGRIHPATRTFQALRIAVNDEIGALAGGTQAAWHLLVPGRKIAVITFHSVEDRAVKQLFVGWEERGEGKRTPRKTIKPSKEEIAENPRARSAKLRVIQTNAAGDNVHVIDARTNKVVGVINDIEVPHGVTLAPDGSRIYITDEALSTVDFVDAKTLNIVARVKLSGHPNNLSITPDGRYTRATDGPFAFPRPQNPLAKAS